MDLGSPGVDLTTVIAMLPQLEQAGVAESLAANRNLERFVSTEVVALLRGPRQSRS